MSSDGRSTIRELDGGHDNRSTITQSYPAGRRLPRQLLAGWANHCKRIDDAGSDFVALAGNPVC